MAIGTAPARVYPKCPPTENGKGTFIDFWQGRTEDKKPNGKPELFKNDDRYTVRYRLKLLSANGIDMKAQQINVPGSFEWPNEYISFAGVFGIKQDEAVRYLNTSDPAGSLTRLKLAILGSAEKVVEFTANEPASTPGSGAWVKRIHDMGVADGPYYGRLSQVTTRKNGKAAHKSYASKNSEYPAQELAWVNLEIVTGALTGSNVPLSVPYPLIIAVDGAAVFPAPTQSGPETKPVQRFKKFVFAATGNPDFFEELVPADQENIMPEIEAAALKAGKPISFSVQGGFAKIDTVQSLPDGTVLAPAAEKPKRESAEKPKRESVEKSKGAILLYKVLEDRLGIDPFNRDGNFTQPAVEWLRENVKPICEANGFSSIIKNMNTEKVVTVLEGLGEHELAVQAHEMGDNVVEQPAAEDF